MNDVTVVSDASTIDEPLNEENGRDDAFAYLQGLNSENLMQFSQQSALQEIMIKEQLDVKGLNVDVLPTFENHDIGGYKFELNFRSNSKTKTNWTYLESLNKVYIRKNEVFSVDVVYTQKLPLQPLCVRAFMCFVNEASKPVLRCHNHMNQDKDLLPPMRHSLLRCENPSAQHCGTAEGKSIKDRYSVIIPLSMNGMPREDKSIKQTIDLKFSCQNSCIGRKETNILFLLEGMSGEVFAQRVINVKICSCPKRDMSIDQKNIETSKRKRENDGYTFCRTAKVRKHNISSQRIKEECSSDSEDESNTKYDVQSTPGGGVRMVMYLCSKEEAIHVLDCARNQVADKMISEANCRGRYAGNYRALKRLRDKALKL